jgi:hypothetical protein
VIGQVDEHRGQRGCEEAKLMTSTSTVSASPDRRSLHPTTIAAMLLSPLGVIIACLTIPSGVDELPSSSEKMASILAVVERHPIATRLGFFAFAVGMLLLIPAMAGLRQSTERQVRGRALVDVGSRLVAVAAGALALGNSFAPASEPSAVRVGLPRDVMVEYMRHHLLNGWDWAIIAFYPLMTIGALLLGIGLWRGHVLSRVTTLLVAVSLFVLIAPPLSAPAVPIGVALELGFLLVVRSQRTSRA